METAVLSRADTVYRVQQSLKALFLVRQQSSENGYCCEKRCLSTVSSSVVFERLADIGRLFGTKKEDPCFRKDLPVFRFGYRTYAVSLYPDRLRWRMRCFTL